MDTPSGQSQSRRTGIPPKLNMLLISQQLPSNSVAFRLPAVSKGASCRGLENGPLLCQGALWLLSSFRCSICAPGARGDLFAGGERGVYTSVTGAAFGVLQPL